MAMEREQGGLIRGARRAAALDRKNATQASGARYGLFLTLASGMDRLVDALVESLPSGTLELGSPVRRIWRPDPAGPWRLEMLDGRALEADLVLNTTEAHAAARLLDSHDSELARDLRTIPYASSAVVGLAYARDQITHPLDGFGVVVPAIEGREILAISFPSVKFAGRSPAGTVLLRVFLGGALQPDIYDRSDDVLIETAVREASSLLGIKGPPRWSELSRHPRGMPQYTLGHLDRVASILARVKLHRGLILAGNAFEGVGIPDCIRSGQAAAESAWALLTDSAQLAA
jgi:oxygen-dependent protoporphyrinogen oxidase